MTMRSILQLCKRRRWALFFLNLVAGLFAAPWLYWTCILMRVILRAAQDEPVLPWLGAIEALGGVPLIMLAALGAGGCLAALRKMLRGEDGFLPREVFAGMRLRAKTSLAAGAVLGSSLGVFRAGLLNLYTFMPAGALRIAASAFLVAQLAVALPLCLLVLTREDELQRRPLRAFSAAGQELARRPVSMPGLAVASVLPSLLFFVWPPPQLTLLGFFFVALCGLVPAMLLWQVPQSRPHRGPRRIRRFVGVDIGGDVRRTEGVVLLIFIALDILILLLPFLGRAPDPQAALGGALDFVSRLYADSGTLLRDLLAASSVWPLLLAALLGSACCIIAAYACACYKFRGRGLMFAAAVLLQILPIIASYSSLEQLLRNLELPISGVWLGLGWALAYLLVALLLVRRFSAMLPDLQKNREQFPGARLFFYYALPRVPLLTLVLIALATLGCWDDALAPFWYMRRLGAFSLSGYIWERMSGPGELALVAGAFAVMLGLCLLVMRLLHSRPPKSRLPRPSAD